MNILLLDGGKAFGHSHGGLNHTASQKSERSFDRARTQCLRNRD